MVLDMISARSYENRLTLLENPLPLLADYPIRRAVREAAAI